MNCKQGDLAVVVRTNGAGLNLGRIVRCVRLIGEHRGWPNVWETDVELVWQNTRVVLDRAAPDACLYPLRGDLLDEELKSTKEVTA